MWGAFFLLMVHAMTFGEVFPDGAMIEPIKCSCEAETLSLVFWDGSEAKIGARIQYNERTYEAAYIEPDLLHAMTLPAEATAFTGCTRQLLAEICEVVQQFSGLDEELGTLVARFVLASWLVGSGPTAPRLSIFGDEAGADAQLLQLLHCLCRHPLRLAEVDAPSIRSLPMEWRPTLLIHQPQLSGRAQRLLNAARTRDVRVPHSGHLLDLHCAVATYSESLQVREPGTFAGIEIQVPAVSNLRTLKPSLEQEIAICFQPKLLGYRLANYAKAARSAFEVSGFTAPMSETLRCLAACTPDDPDLQDEVVRVLKQRVPDPQAGRWTNLNCVVIEALLACCHLDGPDVLYVGQIAEDAAVILQGRGEACEITPKKVGMYLTALGVPRQRDSTGYKLQLTRELRQRIHKLARDFSVPTLDDNQEICTDCRA
jgi:hypothetical protein